MRKVSRRALARSLCATAASATLASAIGSIVSSSAAVGEEFPADPRTVELWMDQWMKRDRIAVGSLHLSRFADPIYFLTKPINWMPNPGQESFAAVMPRRLAPVGSVKLLNTSRRNKHAGP